MMRPPLFIAYAAATLVLAGCKKSRPHGDASVAGRVSTTADSGASPPAHDAAAPPATNTPKEGPAPSHETLGPGFPEPGPWVSFYGTAKQMGDLGKAARTYRIINIDADPGTGNFNDAQVKELRADGKNRVLSYMNVGACEHYRTYWSTAPSGLKSCSGNKGAQRGAYDGYPDETWMDPGDADYQTLLLEHVAPRLAVRVDGFYLDNLEIVEHGSTTKNGPCSATCRQGGLDFVRRLREKFPDHLIVMQNATSDVTRSGRTGDVDFASLLDGVAHEEVFAPKYDSTAEEQLQMWKAMGLHSKAGHPFWIAVEDYAGSCHNQSSARAAMDKSRARGFSPYVSDESGSQKEICYWE